MKTKHQKKTIVMAFGTFDVLHPGHLHFLRQAAGLGDRLIVSVARDKNAKKFKGLTPVFSESDRRSLVASVKFVDRAILGGENNYLPHIQKVKPDIIALGYDQNSYTKELLSDITEGRLHVKIVRLEAFWPKKYKSSKFKSLIGKGYRK